MTWHRRFFWLLILLLPTQLGYHFWPEWAMVLGRRVDYLSPTLYLTDILLLATLFCWLLDGFVRIKNYELRMKGMIKKYTPSIILYSLFFILLVANIYGADSRMVAIYKWGKVVEFFSLGWYIVRTKPKLSAISYPLSAGVFYSSVLAIAQFMLQHSIGGPLWWLGERTFTIDTPGIARIALGGREILRPYAAFPHPNVLGGYIAAILPLVIIQLSNYPIIQLSNGKKTLYFSTFVLGIIALLLTFSRSAIIVGILALASVFFRKKQTLFFLAILLLIFSIFHFPLTFSEESFVVRRQLNTAAVKLWQSAPLFGVGLGNFLVRLPEVLPTRTIYFLQPVHNIYLLLLSEVGVVGVVGVVWVVWNVIAKKKARYPFILHSLFSILLLGLIDHYPLTLQQGQLLLTVLAGMSLVSVH